MSAKYFCDICKTELSTIEQDRLKKKLGPLKIEVMHAFNDVWNSGHVCHMCVVKAVLYGEPFRPYDRPVTIIPAKAS